MNTKPNKLQYGGFGTGMRSVAFIIGLLVVSTIAQAAPPVVKTVPWVSSNPLIPHDTWSGKTITLKGTSDVYGANIKYTWDFGDGSPVATGTVGAVGDKYAIQATHAYTGSAGLVFTATLTVQNTSTGESASKQYYVKIEPKDLTIEVNVAIDEGLWELHKTQTRSSSGGVDLGDWQNWSGYVSVWAANINAFEVNGHNETGDPSNPYVETVARGLRRLMQYLASTAISPQGGMVTDNNGNGIGIYVNQSYPFYQGGMVIDALVASGTPDMVATTGSANVLGKSYRTIVQDMVDCYAYSQYDSTYGSYGILGGWRYGWNEWPDNSACQWAAIGIIAAERVWGITVPVQLKERNMNWLRYSYYDIGGGNGTFGYANPNSFAYGPTATTPSGMVQLAMTGKGRGEPLWDTSERYVRNNFNNMKSFYYGMFSFVKSMLLHDSNADGIGEPITILGEGYAPLKWYDAEAAKGDPTDGVARTLVNSQDAGGWWWYHGPFGGDVYAHETAWAIIMLQRTLFEAGAPVAVAKANPNPAVAGQPISLDGSSSFHQDATKLVDSWEWDLNNDGIFDVSGPFTTVSFPAIGEYPVVLRVTDNGSPEKSAETTLKILVTTPPIAPTADANGPYNFCPGQKPWFLDATASVNPDDGQHQPGNYPGDYMKYEWDLDGDGQFDDAAVAQPDVTAFFEAKGPGSYLIQLRVTDNTAASYPASGYSDLSDTDSTIVVVRASTDPECTCVNNLAARAKPGKIQLTWTSTGAHHYNVYRGTISGGPYLKIGSTTSTYSTYLDQQSVVNGTTYYYVIREANFLDQETCQSNEASATPSLRAIKVEAR
jgi:hypothetical protein